MYPMVAVVAVPMLVLLLAPFLENEPSKKGYHDCSPSNLQSEMHLGGHQIIRGNHRRVTIRLISIAAAAASGGTNR